MVSEGESMTRSPGRLTREVEPENGSSTIKGLGVVSPASRAGAAWVVLRGMVTGEMVAAESEDDECGGGETAFAVRDGMDVALGGAESADKRVEPTIADLSASAFPVISL